jgi:LacI family transcriptional regulator
MAQPRTVSRNSRAARPVTIRDVAARARVSVATVSRVINGIGPVRDETWRRVLQTIERLDYTPHAGARSLSTQRTNSVGMLLPDVYGEFFSELIRGVDLAARVRGFHLLVSGSHADWDEMAAVLAAVRGRVDGMLVMAPDVDTARLGKTLSPGLAVVLVNSGARGFDSISIDNYGGALAMVEHLASRGHRDIIFVHGPAQNADAAERLRGFRDGMARFVGRAGRETEGNFTEESGFEAGIRIAAMKTRPTAVFAANDSTAIGVVSGLRSVGLRVPEQVGVTGFDDIPIARYLTPPLTTVSTSIPDLGRRAFELLMDAITQHGERKPRHETIPTSLVVRDSCGGRVHDQPVRSKKLVSRHKDPGKEEKR